MNPLHISFLLRFPFGFPRGLLLGFSTRTDVNIRRLRSILPLNPASFPINPARAILLAGPGEALSLPPPRPHPAHRNAAAARALRQDAHASALLPGAARWDLAPGGGAAAADSWPSGGPRGRGSRARGRAAGPGPPPPGRARKAPGQGRRPFREAVAAASAGASRPAAPGALSNNSARGAAAAGLPPRQPGRRMRAESRQAGLGASAARARAGVCRPCSPFQVGDLLLLLPGLAYVLTVSERGNHCEFCFAR